MSALFCFLISFDEVIISVFLAGPQTMTLPRVMWESIRFEISPTIAAVSTILIIVSTAVMGVAEALRARLASRRASAVESTP